MTNPRDAIKIHQQGNRDCPVGLCSRKTAPLPLCTAPGCPDGVLHKLNSDLEMCDKCNKQRSPTA